MEVLLALPIMYRTMLLGLITMAIACTIYQRLIHEQWRKQTGRAPSPRGRRNADAYMQKAVREMPESLRRRSSLFGWIALISWISAILVMAVAVHEIR